MQENTLFELFTKDSQQHIVALNEVGVSTEDLLRQQKFIEARLMETKEGTGLTTAQRFAISLVLAREKLLPLAHDYKDILQQIKARTEWAEEQIGQVQIEGAIRSLGVER